MSSPSSCFKLSVLLPSIDLACQAIGSVNQQQSVLQCFYNCFHGDPQLEIHLLLRANKKYILIHAHRDT